jgi:hypothetical protein
MSTSRNPRAERTLKHLEAILIKAIDDKDALQLDKILMNATQGDDSVNFDPYSEKYDEIMARVARYAVGKNRWKMFSELEGYYTNDSGTLGQVKLSNRKTILITAFELKKTDKVSELISNALVWNPLDYEFQTDLTEIIINSEKYSIFKYIHELISNSIKALNSLGSLKKVNQFLSIFKAFEQRYNEARLMKSSQKIVSLYQVTLEMTAPTSAMTRGDDTRTSPDLDAKGTISFFSPASTAKTPMTLSPVILAALNELNQKASEPTCNLESMLMASAQLTSILTLTLQQKDQVDKKPAITV